MTDHSVLTSCETLGHVQAGHLARCARCGEWLVTETPVERNVRLWRTVDGDLFRRVDDLVAAIAAAEATEIDPTRKGYLGSMRVMTERLPATVRLLTSASTCASVPPMTGTIVIRCPEGLHQQLSDRASEQGVSMNQLCVSLLAGGIGFKLEERDMGANICITTELATAVGEIAKQHMRDGTALQIQWPEGNPEQIWEVVATNGSDIELVYEVNDESGHWREQGRLRAGDRIEVAWLPRARSKTPRRVVGTIAALTAENINVREDDTDKLVSVPKSRIVEEAIR